MVLHPHIKRSEAAPCTLLKMTDNMAMCKEFKGICTCAESSIRLSDVGILSEDFMLLLLRAIVTGNETHVDGGASVEHDILPRMSTLILNYTLRCDGVLYVDRSYDIHAPDYVHMRVLLVSTIIMVWNKQNKASVHIGNVGEVVVRKLRDDNISHAVVLLDMCIKETR